MRAPRWRPGSCSWSGSAKDGAAAAADPSGKSGSLLSFSRNRLSGKELALFTRQLSTLTQVSPLEEALRTIMRQSEKLHVRAISGRVHTGIVEGRSLADAMAAEPRSFPGLYRAMISAGERSGSLPALTERLSGLLERQSAMRAKLLAALAYPAAIASFAVIVVTALMIFVVPLVVDQFDTLGQQLPLLTRIIMGLSSFLAHWWWALAILLVLGGIGAWARAQDRVRAPALRRRDPAHALHRPAAARSSRRPAWRARSPPWSRAACR